jgi:hypothetical protein
MPVTLGASTITMNSGSVIQDPPGTAPSYLCRAWVNFNGTTSPGTIRASGNVSSVTKNGAGDYTVNFTTAMPDANYAVTWMAAEATQSNSFYSTEEWLQSLATSSVRVRLTRNFAGGFVAFDSSQCNLSIFR